MKIDRLLGIITILMQRKKVTAQYFAEHFEVSRRTIHRDIDAICRAGIPIVTLQGADGGISIADGFVLDKQALTDRDLASILTGLQGLGSIAENPQVKNLIHKLSPNGQPGAAPADMRIDLSAFHRASLSSKITAISTAITQSRRICFQYYSDKGTSDRTLDSYHLQYKWNAWYVYGFCAAQNGFRLFKLNRLWNLTVTQEPFRRKDPPPQEDMEDRFLTEENRIVALFDPAVEYLLVEEYGPGSYRNAADGSLEFDFHYTNKEYMIRWLLGFGDRVKVLYPSDLAAEICESAKKILRLYNE